MSITVNIHRLDFEVIVEEGGQRHKRRETLVRIPGTETITDAQVEACADRVIDEITDDIRKARNG